MERQGSFAQAEYTKKKKQTRRDKFSAEMDDLVPWARFVARLQPLYPKGERGREPIALELMLRIYFLQQWYGLADEALEDALYDSQALRGFAGIDLTVDAVPDATTVLHFRHWLERYELTKALFEEIGAMLAEHSLLDAPGCRCGCHHHRRPALDQEQRKGARPGDAPDQKGQPWISGCQWHFGMKAHIGVDVASGVVHTVTGTAANEADITQMAAVLHGQEEAVFADAGYTGADKRPEHADRDVSWNIAIKRSIIKALPKALRDWPSRWSARWRRCGPGSSTPSTSSRTASTIRNCAIAACSQEHRAIAHSVRAGQSGDSQEGSARSTRLTIPKFVPIRKQHRKPGPTPDLYHRDRHPRGAPPQNQAAAAEPSAILAMFSVSIETARNAVRKSLMRSGR